MNDTIHTEIVCGGRHIGFDLWCSEACLQEHLNTNYIYEPEVTAAILNFVRPGDFCIDAGANLGYHSTLMAKLVGKDGLVLAFEPDQDCFEKMQRNFLLNEVDDICFPNPVALWNEDYQSFAFFIGPCGYSSVVRYSALAQTASSVQTRALDNIINSDVHVKLLKIDCEGAEEKILHGAEQLLRRGVDAVIVEFNYELMECWKDGDKPLRKFMRNLGYDFFYLFDDGRFPEWILHDVPIRRGEGHYHFNALFTKRNFLQEHWQLSPMRIV